MMEPYTHKKRGALATLAAAALIMKEKVDAFQIAAQAASDAEGFGQEMLDLKEAYNSMGRLDTLYFKEARFLALNLRPDVFLAHHTMKKKQPNE